MAESHRENPNTIELTLPIDPAYVSVARLTASSISERMNFSSEAVEDIKGAVSEACIYIIKRCTLGGTNRFTLRFSSEIEDTLIICLKTSLSNTILTQCPEDDLGMCMMESLVDKLEIFFEEGGIGIRLAKKRLKKCLNTEI